MLSIGLLYSLLTYSETGMLDQDERALTLRSAWEHKITPKLDLSVGGFATLFPLKKTYAPAARFVGVDARLGWTPYTSKAQTFRFTLYGGVFYTTMLIENDTYGFHHMSGPELIPAFEYRISSGSKVSGYGKIAIATQTTENGGLSNRELAAGGALTFTNSRGNYISVAAEYGVINLSLLYAGETVSIHSRSTSIGLVYGW